MLKPPNQPLQQTGHANDVAADFFAAVVDASSNLLPIWHAHDMHIL